MTEIPHPLGLLIRNLELHVDLAPEDRDAIRALPHRLRTLDAATYLVREGDLPDHCVILVSGFAFRQKLTGDGLRQIMALHIPGDALDFQHLFLDVADHSVQMLTRGEVAIVARKDLHQLIHSRKAIAEAVMVSILVEASIFREWILNVGRRDARTRMAHLLCEFAIRMQAQGLAGPGGYELPITQEQLADVLGLTPVHINRTLKALEASGVISRSKRTIRFVNWERLREVGDFSQRYLHLEPQLAGNPTDAHSPRRSPRGPVSIARTAVVPLSGAAKAATRQESPNR